jgi:hypothetical protein
MAPGVTQRSAACCSPTPQASRRCGKSVDPTPFHYLGQLSPRRKALTSQYPPSPPWVVPTQGAVDLQTQPLQLEWSCSMQHILGDTREAGLCMLPTAPAHTNKAQHAAVGQICSLQVAGWESSLHLGATCWQSSGTPKL